MKRKRVIVQTRIDPGTHRIVLEHRVERPPFWSWGVPLEVIATIWLPYLSPVDLFRLLHVDRTFHRAVAGFRSPDTLQLLYYWINTCSMHYATIRRSMPNMLSSQLIRQLPRHAFHRPFHLVHRVDDRRPELMMPRKLSPVHIDVEAMLNIILHLPQLHVPLHFMVQWYRTRHAALDEDRRRIKQLCVRENVEPQSVRTLYTRPLQQLLSPAQQHGGLVRLLWQRYRARGTKVFAVWSAHLSQLDSKRFATWSDALFKQKLKRTRLESAHTLSPWTQYMEGITMKMPVWNQEEAICVQRMFGN